MGYDGSLKFNTEINESGFNSGISKLGGIASGGLKVIAGSVAGVAAAFGAVSKMSLDSVASLEQNIGGVETLFKDSAQTVIDNANNAYKTAGVSANKYMETVTSFSASLLQGLGNNTAEAARIADMAMVDMSDNANKFGSNMTDIQNAYQGFAKQNYTMLDNLKLGYGGTQAEMIRLINDSGILNEKIENLDNVSFDQIIQAIHKIQENMGIAGTTSAEALTTIEGSVQSAKAAFDNFLNGSSSPQELADAVKAAAENITNNLMQIVPRLAKELPEVGNLLMDSLSQSLNSGKLGEMMQIGGQVISNITTGIIQALPGIVTASAQIISSFAQNISTSIPQLLSSGIQIIQAIVSGMMQILPSVGSLAIQLITTLYEQLTTQGPSLLQQGYELLSNLIDGFVQAIPEALPKVLDFIQGIGEKLAEAAPVMIQKGFELLQKLVEGIVSAIPILIERVPEIISTFANIINDNFPTILMKGAELLGQLALGLIQAIPTLIVNIPQIIAAIVDTLMAFQWLNLGKNIIKFLGDGITSMIDFVKTAGTNILNGIKSSIQNLPSTLANIGKSAIHNLGSTISGMVSYVKTAALKIASGIESAILTLPDKMASIGSNIVQGLWNGISNMTGWIIDKIGGFASSVVSSIKDFFGIHSPSRVMRDQVGKYLAMGVGVGYEEYMPYEEMKKVSGKVVSQLSASVNGITLSVPESAGSQTYQKSVGIQRSGNNDELLYAVDRLSRLANRPLEIVNKIDSVETSRVLATPMQNQIKKNQDFKKMLGGDRN
ncbi:phage tail protein [Mediterraneibacter gnavus]|uniref:phage tail protein n=1 Tax=Mediterraneibacter gnavus TaxID=33038 RepID=UPI00232AD2B2|nr:hypothetical protein [Mediterraneibacter gnavus]MDB8711678.1 hypothetical protein [Mediterraneibacter gnavus]MDB8714688.1 hypothetical protein [Mediterraneibacter gnavus]